MVDFLRWFFFEANVLDVKTRYWLAYLAAAGCFVITAYFAREVRANARLFTVLALFAGTWALVMAIYGTAPYPDMGQAPSAAVAAKSQSAFRLHDTAEDLASFLMVFAGAILARERDDEHWFFNSQRLQVAAMSILVLLAIPHRLPESWNIPAPTAELVLASALGLLAFLALALGAKAVADQKQFVWLLWIIIVYAVLTTARNVELLVAVKRNPQSDFFALSFASLKLLMTFFFGYIVLYHYRFGKTKR